MLRPRNLKLTIRCDGVPNSIGAGKENKTQGGLNVGDNVIAFQGVR